MEINLKYIKNSDPRVEKSRNALISAGLVLLNENKDASLSEIASFANIGRATLYRQFNNREDLVKAIAINCTNTLDEATKDIETQSKSALNAIELLFKTILPLTKELKFIMNISSIVANDPDLLTIEKKQQKEMIMLIDLAKSEGSISRDVPSDWIVSVIDGLFYSSWLMISMNQLTKDEIAELAFQTLCNGIKK